MQQGRIAGLRIFGDFMGRSDVGELEARLLSVAYKRDAMIDALGSLDLPSYFGEVSGEDVLGSLCP